MLTLFFSIITYSILITIFTSSTPLTLGFIILILALALALTTATITSTWFGFIIFLIYIGGILVIFAYFAALIPNSSPSLIVTTISLISVFTLLIIYFYPYAPTLSQTLLTPINNTLPALALFSSNNLLPLLLLALILFLALISVVKISNLFAGPLRPFTPNP